MKKAAINKIKPVMKELNSRQVVSKDAFICEIETFELVYNLEKRRLKRSDSPAFILSLKVIGEGLMEEELDKTTTRVIDTFERRLRPGDAVCKLDENNFVLLINNIDEKTIKRLIERINHFFYSLSNINNRETWVDIFKRIGFIWDYKTIQG